jgi:cysteinyl-tRNA synthetase
MSPLQLYNPRTRAKETFVPADPSGQVGLFVCGPTVYDLPHLGHAKTYTQFDFLVRLLRACGFAVTYVQNITDVDDKIIRRAPPGPCAGHDAGRRTSVTRHVDRHAPSRAASRSSQARSHRRHSSADRRQCSW